MEIGEKIRQRRCELGMSLRELAERMGYNNHSTIARIENGDINLPISRVAQFAKILGLSVEYLIGTDDAIQMEDAVPQKEEGQRADSREVFSENLRSLMVRTGKSRKAVCEDLCISYYTFSDWYNGKKYPRIEKLESMAQYFGVSVTELVGESKYIRQYETNRNSKNAVLDIILRLHTDSDFLQIVEKMNALDDKKFNALKQLIVAFGE